MKLFPKYILSLCVLLLSGHIPLTALPFNVNASFERIQSTADIQSADTTHNHFNSLHSGSSSSHTGKHAIHGGIAEAEVEDVLFKKQFEKYYRTTAVVTQSILSTNASAFWSSCMSVSHASSSRYILFQAFRI